MTRAPSDDGHLLRQLAHGDAPVARTALETLYERHGAAVASFLARVLPANTDMEDVLHDTFLAAARRAAGFREGNARAWLCRIAAWRAADLQRAASRRRARERAVSRPEETHASPVPKDPELEAAMVRLPAHLRATLELRFGAELTHGQVAEALGVSLRTAKTWCEKAKEALARELDHGGWARRRQA